MRFHTTAFESSFSAAHRKAFSLVEVVLAVGVLAVSVLALLGMMGPAFRQAKGVTETNAATAVIGKLNAVLQDADFSDIYDMVTASATAGSQSSSLPPNPNRLGIFIFYTEESFDNGAGTTRYRDRVAYYAGGATIAKASSYYGWNSLSSLSNALDPTSNSDWRVMPPVIAVVLSLSPIVKDQSEANSITYTAANPYSTSNLLLPTYSLPAAASYPLGMLPIMASVFVIPNPTSDITGNTFNSTQAQSFLTLPNRIFTFQAVKLR